MKRKIGAYPIEHLRYKAILFLQVINHIDLLLPLDFREVLALLAGMQL